MADPTISKIYVRIDRMGHRGQYREANDRVDRTRAPDGMRWVPIATLTDEALPNVMRKVVAHALNV